MYSNPDDEDYKGMPGSYGYKVPDGSHSDDEDDDSLPSSGDEDDDIMSGSGGDSIMSGSGGDSDNSDFLGGHGQKRNAYGSGKGKGKNKKSKGPQTLTIWRKEDAVGITEYLGTHEGFFAIIKQRYKDFQVNEINAQGEVIYYTNDSISDPPNKKEHIVTEGTPACVPEEKISEIDHMFDVHSKTANEKDKKDKRMIYEVLIKVDGLEKQERFSIHSFIKNRYKKVITSTKEIKGEKYIQVRRGITDDRWNNKISWPETQKYTYFVLYKENMDTIEAINKVASMIKVKPPKFCCLGYKDKRCVSSQLVSVPEVNPQRLYNVTKDNWAIKVGNFCYKNEPLKLGQFSGNRFRIVLRKISASDEVVNKAVERLKCNGFINYYGMHRFGTSNVSNYNIGKLLLQGSWSEVVNFILTPSSTNFHGENYFMNMALQEYNKNGNVVQALKQLDDCQKGSSLEAQILRGISECGKDDLVGALSKLPRNSIVQYLHAYQSFIWNSIASRRIKQFGVTVLPGDLVWRLPSALNKEKFLREINETIDAEDSTSVAELTQEEAEDNNFGNNKNVHIHVLTAEEAKNTDISQILLPLPGYDILLPENEMKDWYVEMLVKDGLTLEKLQNSVKAYSARGVYRCLLVQPSDVSHCITYYNDVSKSLVQSDKEKLKGEDVEKNKLEGLPGLEEGKKPKPLEPMDVDGPSAGKSESNQLTDQKDKNKESDDENTAMEEGSEGCSGTNGAGANGSFIMGRYGAYGQPRFDMTKGKMKALILELALPASSYASMALRELLKIDSSTQFQNILDPSRANMELGRGNTSFGRGRGRKSKRRRRC